MIVTDATDQKISIYLSINYKIVQNTKYRAKMYNDDHINDETQDTK